MQIEKLLEGQKSKAHIHWLNRAKTAKVDGMELTVLPYGFLTQAVEKSVNEILKQFIDGLVEFQNSKLPDTCDCTGAEYECEHWGRHEMIAESISHLKEIRAKLK